MRKLNYWVFLLLLHMPAAVWAQPEIEEVVVIALSPLDESAVVRLSNQGLQVIKPGDTVRGTDLSLIQVLTNKLVFEEKPGHVDSNTSGRVVWLHKAVNGISAIEYPAVPQ